MNSENQFLLHKKLLIFFCMFVCTILLKLPAMSQERPPKPISVRVSTIQHLSFGSFIQAGNYGTVTVTHQQMRTATGSIILPNLSSIVTSALFEVDAIPGTLITIVNGPDSSLNGSNGGTIMLKPGDASTGSPFIATSETTNVFIGGTLTIGPLSANPAGAYNGTFQVTFIQQ
jgi:hypothetical protein